MRSFKENKGITLISLVVYIILTIIVLGMLTILTENFRNNINNTNVQTVQDVEFDKLNLQLVKETKDITNRIVEKDSSETKIVFTNGNIYEYIEEDNTIYLNGDIKIADNIESCIFQIEKTKTLSGNVASENVKYTDKNGDIAVIPAGFAVSGKESEQTIEDGLVIYCGLQDTKQRLIATVKIMGQQRVTEYVLANKGAIDWNDGTEVAQAQKTYDQFVWIPVEEAYITAKEITDMINSTETEYASVTSNQTAINYLASKGRYPMAVQLDNGEDYRGILYNFAAGTNGVTITSYADFSILEADDYTLKTYYREPAYLTDEDYADGGSYNTIGLTQEKLQDEYNKMVESVKDNEGFYVARYELTGNSTDGYGSKRGQIVANARTANMWYGLYSACQGMYNQTTDKVQSTMISGAQWDQIMIWMKDVKNINDSSKYYVLDGSYMGNYTIETGGTGTIQVSGYLDNYSVKKVFDLGGNLYDYTTEAYHTSIRVGRGRWYDKSGDSSPASYRGSNDPNSISAGYSARPALYVK